jgi:hypothetical protein
MREFEKPQYSNSSRVTCLMLFPWKIGFGVQTRRRSKCKQEWLARLRCCWEFKARNMELNKRSIFCVLARRWRISYRGFGGSWHYYQGLKKSKAHYMMLNFGPPESQLTPHVHSDFSISFVKILKDSSLCRCNMSTLKTLLSSPYLRKLS